MAITIELLALSLLIVAGSGHQLKNETENVRVLKIVSTGSERNLKGEITGSDRNVSRETVGNDQFVHAMLGTKITVRPGRHVCTAEKVTSRPVKVTKTYKKPIYTNHPRDCSDFNNCPQFDVRYEETNRTFFLLQKYSSFRHSCCPGWTKGNKREKGCMAPICTGGCGDFGVCIKPETCQCPRGFEGEMCDTDIDECRNTEHGCQQICKNTAGSYMCACHTGFILAEDGKTCVYCYTCQKEYTDMVLSVESMKKQLSESLSLQAERIQSFKTDENTLTDRLKTLEEDIRDLKDRNSRLEEDLLEIHEKYETASQDIERLQNISMATQATPIFHTTTQPTTTTTTTPTTTPTSTTTTTPTTTTAGQDKNGGGLEFSAEDMLYSLSNQVGMMEEKLELCNCHARRRP